MNDKNTNTISSQNKDCYRFHIYINLILSDKSNIDKMLLKYLIHYMYLINHAYSSHSSTLLYFKYPALQQASVGSGTDYILLPSTGWDQDKKKMISGNEMEWESKGIFRSNRMRLGLE